nr:ABC transporter ATP-binding protein [Candidatus Njordarchaeum guaymaensis]
MNDLLEAKNITKVFSLGGLVRKKYVTAVENFSFGITEDTQMVTTLAGESGSGKTTITNMLLGFLKPTKGEILYRGQNIWKMKRRDWRNYRRDVQAVFQDPYETLNPVHKIDYVLMEPIKKFKLADSKADATKMMSEVLYSVGLSSEEVLDKYPHQLSGGQRQRAMLARVFLIRPRILLADEPVSMIDVSLRADILEIIQKLQKENDMSCLYITHDLSNAYCISDEIIILYLGSVMEQGDFETIVKDPMHPYVKTLISSISIPNPRARWKGKVRLQDIEIARLETITGCKFCNRCSESIPICKQKEPPLTEVGKNRRVACHLYL